MDGWHNRLNLRWEDFLERSGARALLSPVLVSFFLLILVALLLGAYWSREPRQFAVASPSEGAGRPGRVVLLVQERILAELTDKPGGYLDNDLLPPGSLVDNLPAWERGVLAQSRDLVAILRGDPATSVPGTEDLAEAAEALAVYPGAWSLPSAEGEFGRARSALRRQADRLGGRDGAALVMREAHLASWLGIAERRLGGLTARLNAARLIAGSPAVASSTDAAGTSWALVDDVFYEARGSSWALLHLLKAIEVDFGGLLARRRADLGLRAAIHELEATQQPLLSPVVLNGAGFGPFANHSLVLANYLNRARADLAEVRALLQPPPPAG